MQIPRISVPIVPNKAENPVNGIGYASRLGTDIGYGAIRREEGSRLSTTTSSWVGREGERGGKRERRERKREEEREERGEEREGQRAERRREREGEGEKGTQRAGEEREKGAREKGESESERRRAAT
eukprot:3740752-Rhodomonas_salina.1